MIKILVMQQLCTMAKDAFAYQFLDRCNFLRFLYLTDRSSISNAETICLFCHRLANAVADNQVFEQAQQQLLSQD